jgi:hypothetical protein
MRRLILFFASAVLFLAPALASAQVYKWVDEKGVVNYSSQPPIERKATLLDPNSVSVSSYTPDETLTRAATTTPSANERALAERIASLERRLEAERYSRQILADAQARALEMRFEQCLRDRRLDCDYAGFDPYFAPYGPTIVVFRPNLRPRPIVPSRPALAPKPPRSSFVPSRASRLVSSTM